MSFLAGAYTMTYNGAAAGQLFEGITFSWVTYGEPITGDNHARAVQDIVYQGIDMTSDFSLNEWNAAAAASMYWPWGASWGTAAVPGRLAVQQSIAKQIVLTAIAGTAAAAIGGAAAPTAVTLPRSILHEGFPVNVIFRPAHRRVPLRMRHFPDSQYVYGTLS